MALTRKHVLLLASASVIVAAVVVAGPWIYGSRPGMSVAPGEIAVVAQPAKVTTLKETVTGAGIVTPQAAADLVISATEAGSIAEMPKQEGETVQAGDIVVRLDIPAVTAEIATRQLEVSEATSRMETTKAEAARIGGLYEKGLAARTQSEAARAAFMAADSALAQARGRLESAKVAEAATVIRARFAGVVAKRWHNVGDAVSGVETDPILRIVDMNRLQISVPFPAAEAVRILPGQLAEVQTEAGPQAAVVSLKLGTPSATAPATDVRLNFSTPTTLPLDSPVQVSIVVNERRDVLVVAADAIQRVESQTFVWLVNSNIQAERREVRIGYIANGQAEVVSGLTAGELVITAGISELTEGTRVVIGR